MSLKKKSLSNKKKSLKKSLEKRNSDKTQFLLSKLEIDTLINTNLLDITDYRDNQEYFQETVFSRNDSTLTRMWLIHLLGGKASADHFFYDNGTLRSDKNIHQQILKILSWRGTELNDFWWYQKLSKQLLKTWGHVMLGASYLKQISHFVNTFVTRFLQIFNIEKYSSYTHDAKTVFSLIFGSSLGVSHFFFEKEFKKLISTLFQIGKQGNVIPNTFFFKRLKDSSKTFLVSYGILILLISVYESYYYQIERDHLRKYLTQGLSDNHRTQIVKFKEILFEFEEQVTLLSIKTNSELSSLIDKYYNRTFERTIFSFYKKQKSFKQILKDELGQNRDLSEYYQELKKNKSIHLLAIYFFKQNGTPRTTRESVCSIIQGLQNISSNTMKILFKSSIISSNRQLNLTMTQRTGSSRKKTVKKKLEMDI